MALADVATDVSEPFVHAYSADTLSICEARFKTLMDRALGKLQDQGIDQTSVGYECFLSLQYKGSDTTLMIARPADNDFAAAFAEEHKREFAFNSDSPIMVAAVRVRATSKTRSAHLNESSPYFEELQLLRDSELHVGTPQPFSANKVYFEEAGQFVDTPLFRLSDLVPGMVIPGPAIILDKTQTVVLHPQNVARILKSHILYVACTVLEPADAQYRRRSGTQESHRLDLGGPHSAIDI